VQQGRKVRRKKKIAYKHTTKKHGKDPEGVLSVSPGERNLYLPYNNH
jgi:hypothetical protein